MARFRSAYMAILLSVATSSYAGDGALTRFYNSFGAGSNLTNPTHFHDQAAGHYTGGGLVLRGKNKTVQPINVSLPHIGTDGCNKIDMYFGSLSFVKGEELAQLGRSAISGAPSYALQLALKTMAPQIENLLTQLRKEIMDLNKHMMNSCRLTQQVVGGVWPKSREASEYICKQEKMADNSDSFAAQKHCQKDDKVQQGIEQAKAKHPDLMAGEYNLVWHVMKKMPDYQDNRELAEFVMTLVGTLLSRKDGNKYRYYFFAPKADSEEFLAANLKGGDTQKLTCNETEKCLDPHKVPFTVPEGLGEKVHKRIVDLTTKYKQNQAITADDLSFLNDSVAFPVYKYIQVSAAANRHFLTQDASQYIAISVLLYQFDKIIGEVLEAVDLIASIQVDDTALQKFRENLMRAKTLIQTRMTTSNMKAIWQLMQLIQAEEKSITIQQTQ